MADLSLDNYIVKSGLNKRIQKKRINISANNPRQHMLSAQRRGLKNNRNLGITKQLQPKKPKPKISDVNKITAPSTVVPMRKPAISQSRALNIARRNANQSTSNLSGIDARQKILKNKRVDARINMATKVDARTRLLSNTKLHTAGIQPRVRPQTLEGMQVMTGVRSANNTSLSQRSDIPLSTGVIKPPLKPMTSNAVSKPKKPPGSVKLTRTVNNEADTELVEGVLKRTLNTKIANDSVVILDPDLHFTIPNASLPKQRRLDANFLITKPNFQGVKITPPGPDTTQQAKSDPYHFTRQRPSANLGDHPGVYPTSNEHRNPSNIIRLKTASFTPEQTSQKQSLTGAELRQRVSSVKQAANVAQSIHRGLSETNLADSVDIANVDKSIKFTVHTDIHPTTIESKKLVVNEGGGPLRLYRASKEESLPVQVARHTAENGRGPPGGVAVKSARTNAVSAIVTSQAQDWVKASGQLSTGKVKVMPPPAVSETDSSNYGDILSPLQGYRIVVTNLHPVVDQDDVIELFGSVGSLKKAQLIKVGHATVVYQDKESAIAAVRKFHSRELDGQPMQVKLVTSLTATAPGTVGMSAEIKALIAKSEKNEDSHPTPDVSPALISRALFKTGVASAPLKPVTFTVKI